MSPQSDKATSPGPAQTESGVNWYALTPTEVASRLQVGLDRGLSAAEAQQRLQQYGPNHLVDTNKEPGWKAFLRQYKDLMQIVLLVAAIVNQIFTGKWGTTLVLASLTVFNAMLGLRGESKAAASLEELAGTMKSITHVRRDGVAQEVDIAQVVPGDVVLMEAGDVVPADGRLFVTATMEIEEAALTGESVASFKNSEIIEGAEVPLGDRHNMAYMNTSVTRGRGEMVVTTTGMGTEMGHIADLLNKTKADKTPLQKQLDRLTMIIAALAGLAFILMVTVGPITGTLDDIFIAGVALHRPSPVSAVVITMYSMGTRELAAQNAIVKRCHRWRLWLSRLYADKTGTLTLNKMTAVEFTVPGQNRYHVTGEGYGTRGELKLTQGIPAGQPWQKSTTPYSTGGKIQSAGGTRIDLDQVLLPMALCADARLDGETLIGDPTEGALVVLAEKGASMWTARESCFRV